MPAVIAPEAQGFDGDELFLLCASGVLCLGGLVHWVVKLRPVSKLGCHRLLRAPLYGAVFSGFVVLAWVVRQWADQQIRDYSGYVLLVFLMGGACLTIVAGLLPWLGVGLREDVFEQRNFAAVMALSGAAFAVLINYSAATVGEGPSFWNNVFATLLATGALLSIWGIVGWAGGAAVAISEERDLASGLRIGLLFVAESLILGRAVAGNWESVEGTVRDFLHEGWPALALAVAAIMVERTLRPTSRNPKPSLVSHGIVPAMIYLLIALVWCAHLGWWEGARQ